ncbi:helix-turn-helix transcriptional regulator [Streptomyces sp. NPDC049040]|uniref:helix-turn-helix transcriptional regulator n=1 Tax=Streptomyces sp. NPDC049040 TaxID=3365593 RepID=UPI003715F1E8
MCKPEWRRARIQAQRLADLAGLRRVRDRIGREYAQPLDVEALARAGDVSAGHLSRQFRAAYGESPYAYLTRRRIERATALLRRGDLSVTEVCFAVGCASPATFTTRFTELVGMPPEAFRRAAEAAADHPHAAGANRDARPASRSQGVPGYAAKQVPRPVRNREAPASAGPLR